MSKKTAKTKPSKNLLFRQVGAAVEQLEAQGHDVAELRRELENLRSSQSRVVSRAVGAKPKSDEWVEERLQEYLAVFLPMITPQAPAPVERPTTLTRLTLMSQPSAVMLAQELGIEEPLRQPRGVKRLIAEKLGLVDEDATAS